MFRACSDLGHPAVNLHSFHHNKIPVLCQSNRPPVLGGFTCFFVFFLQNSPRLLTLAFFKDINMLDYNELFYLKEYVPMANNYVFNDIYR